MEKRHRKRATRTRQGTPNPGDERASRPNRPLKLTEHGWSIVNHMNAQAWVREQTDRLKHDITEMKLTRWTATHTRCSRNTGCSNRKQSACSPRSASCTTRCRNPRTNTARPGGRARRSAGAAARRLAERAAGRQPRDGWRSRMTTTINVAREFTRHPGPRYRHQGNGSGQAFRDDQLIPAMKKNSEQGGRTRIDLDGAAYGYPIGWLEEVFGGSRARAGAGSRTADRSRGRR